MKKYKIGFTQGTFDMLHIGHVNLINHAKELCEVLVVGVNSDELVQAYKNKKPVICEEDRRTLVANLKAVDRCVITHTLDKEDAWNRFHFDAIFIGDDWKGNARWQKTEDELRPFGAVVEYLPHTDGISSTQLRPVESQKVDECVVVTGQEK